jgi:FMN phosphatase YigB (HAD superfamily)
MKIRAAIFDLYGTLLELAPARPDAEAGWTNLWQQMLGVEPPLTRIDFSKRCDAIISREHLAARSLGIPWPEVFWPAVVAEAAPDVVPLTPERYEEFLFRLAQLDHSTGMRRAAAELLRSLIKNQCVLGIASNAQPYTRRELAQALAVHDLGPDIFEPDLCFWSYLHGFSKPDPHVFQLLSARLQARGISPAETLMVGDRRDNDIEPARAHGWQTWQFAPEHQPGGGDWDHLLAALSHEEEPLKKPGFIAGL